MVADRCFRNDFGFGGFVVSDANAVRSMEAQHDATDLTEAGARALHAGLDMEMAMFDPGETSPGGKLPFTWPRHVGQVPMVGSSTQNHDWIG